MLIQELLRTCCSGQLCCVVCSQLDRSTEDHTRYRGTSVLHNNRDSATADSTGSESTVIALGVSGTQVRVECTLVSIGTTGSDIYASLMGHFVVNTNINVDTAVEYLVVSPITRAMVASRCVGTLSGTAVDAGSADWVADFALVDVDTVGRDQVPTIATEPLATALDLDAVVAILVANSLRRDLVPSGTGLACVAAFVVNTRGTSVTGAAGLALVDVDTNSAFLVEFITIVANNWPTGSGGPTFFMTHPGGHSH